MTQNKEWIEWVWTAEKPYPDVSSKVYIRHNTLWESMTCDFVRHWKWDIDENGEHITHYKLA